MILKNNKSVLHPSYIHIDGLGDHTGLESCIQSWTSYIIIVSSSYSKIFSYAVFFSGWKYWFKKHHWMIKWNLCINTYLRLLYHMKVPVIREHNYPYKIQYITYLLVVSSGFTRGYILPYGCYISNVNIQGCVWCNPRKVL